MPPAPRHAYIKITEMTKSGSYAAYWGHRMIARSTAPEQAAARYLMDEGVEYMSTRSFKRIRTDTWQKSKATE